MVRCLSNGVRETDQRNYSKKNPRLLVEEVRGGRLLGERKARGERGRGGNTKGVGSGRNRGKIGNNASRLKGRIQEKRGSNRECKRREGGGLDSPAPILF